MFISYKSIIHAREEVEVVVELQVGDFVEIARMTVPSFYTDASFLQYPSQCFVQQIDQPLPLTIDWS